MSSSSAASEAGLAAAFGVAPQGTSELEFVDWDARKRVFGVDGPSSAMTAAERAAFFQRLLKAGIGPGKEITVPADTQYDAWGFDAIDLSWEADVSPGDNEASFTVLAFDPGAFDVSALPGRFASCGWQRTGSGRMAVYTTEVDNRCLSIPPIGMPIGLPTLPQGATGAAVVPDRNLLVVSFGRDEIRSELQLLAKGGPTLADVSEAGDLTGALTGGDAAYLRFGLSTCSDLFQSSIGSNPTPANFEKLRRVQAKLGGAPYLAVGASQQFVPRPGDGTLAFLYPSDAEAKADLAKRSKADTAPSFDKGKTYGEFAFHVDDARANGPVVHLGVSEPPGATSDVMAQLYLGDASFALCRV